MVSYEDPASAQAAINWFNGTELLGSTLNVQFAQRKNQSFPERGGRGGFGGPRGGRGGVGGPSRGGRGGYSVDRPQSGDPSNDWICPG